MKFLNAYNETVQDFMKNPKHKLKKRKTYNKTRMELFILSEKARNAGFIFEEIFPNKKEKILKILLDLLSKTGITKIKAETLAKKANCSIGTVYKTVKLIKLGNQILVARLKSRDKNNGHYIFVDKTSENFELIMKEVFKLSDEDIKELIQ